MKILLIQTGFLGDVVLSTPVIAAIAEQYPGSSITFLTTPLAVDLVKHHPLLEDTIAFDKRGARRGLGGLLSMARELRSRKFDIVFSLHKSWRSAALVGLSGIAQRYGFRKAKARFVYTATAARADLEHEVLRNLAIMRTMGAEPNDLPQRMHIEIPNEAFESVKQHLNGFLESGFVAVAPGSVWPTKRWTPQGFAAVAKRISDAGLGVAILGGPNDRACAQEMLRHIGSDSKRIVDLSGETSLIESAAVVAQARLLVCNDSAPLHMASALGTPVVAVFCATVPEFGFGPWLVRNECVGLDSLDCRPCARHGGKTCPLGTYACQLDLSPQLVAQAALRLLENRDDAAAILPEEAC